MKNTSWLIAFLLLAFTSFISCGDDHPGNPDAPNGIDAMLQDSAPPMDVTHTAPPPPVIGAQIDRMGRPAINTALNAVLAPVAADATAQKDAYNAASNPATWATTVLRETTTVQAEFQANLAVFDVLDQGMTNVPNAGCGNQLLFNGTAAGGGAPAATSYATLAGILADDRLYVDTSKKTCSRYLSLELDVATGGTVAHTDCGGRALSYDVIDFTYSVLVGGVHAFTTDMNRNPLITDGGGATRVINHSDSSDSSFPFLGPPTNP